MIKVKPVVFIITHPIQYFTPLYRYIQEHGLLTCEVWFLDDHGTNTYFDKEFKTDIKWDIPLLEGYPHLFLSNNSWNPGLYKGFFGLINLELISKLKTIPKKSIIVIPGWDNFSYLLAIVAGKYFGHLVCLRGDTPLSHEAFKKGIKFQLRRFFLISLIFKCVHRFLYVGQQNMKFYKLYGIKPNKLIFTPFAVNNEFFSRKKEQLKGNRFQIKKELNIPEDYNVILFSGKLIEKKNPLDLLKAFKILSTKLKYLVLMGDGLLRKELETMIKEDGIENVIITGFINQSMVSKYYAIADVYVMCSGLGENWGLSTNEAMNFGVPIVVSDLTGNAEDLVDGNGYVFKTGDIEELAEKIDKILTRSVEGRNIFGQRSLEIISKYSYEETMKGLLQIDLNN